MGKVLVFPAPGSVHDVPLLAPTKPDAAPNEADAALRAKYGHVLVSVRLLPRPQTVDLLHKRERLEAEEKARRHALGENAPAITAQGSKDVFVIGTEIVSAMCAGVKGIRIGSIDLSDANLESGKLAELLRDMGLLSLVMWACIRGQDPTPEQLDC